MDRLKTLLARLTLADRLFLCGALGFSLWLMWHTFSYDAARGSFLVGNLNGGDFLVHVPMIRSFSLGGNWPVEYPFFPGEPCRYHYLFFAGVGFLERMGLRIDWALNLPSALSFFALLAVTYGFAFSLYRSRRVAGLSVLFLLFNGSLSLFRFAANLPDADRFFAEVWGLKDYLSGGPYNGSEIAQFWTLNPFLNQRHLAFALAFVIFLHWLTRGIRNYPVLTQRITGMAAGAVAGFFPLYHQPGLFMLAVTGVVFLITEKGSRPFLIPFGLATATVALCLFPLLTGLMGNSAAGPQFHPGYLMRGRFLPWNVTRYWFINLGPHFLLIPLGIWLSTPDQRKAYLPTLCIFVVALLVQFGAAPELNHKFFNFCIVVAQIASAYALVSIADEGLAAWRSQRGKLAGITLLAVFALGTLLAVASGIADFMPIKNAVLIPVVDYPRDETAQWILRNTPSRAVFLTSRPDFAPPSLVGRPILLGIPVFAQSLNYDYEKRRDLAVTAWAGRNLPEVCSALKALKADYLLNEARRKHDDIPTLNGEFFRKQIRPAFRSGDGRAEIFSVKELCYSH